MISKKDILDSVINNDLYKAAFKNLTDDQKKKVNEIINEFIDNFSMRVLSNIQNSINTKE